MDTPSSPLKPEVLVIGLDGATFDVIEPLVARGQLPNIARLLQQGARGKLRSTIPPYSAAAWTTFLTGLNPGHHGVSGFTEFDPQSYQCHPRGRYTDESRLLLGMLNAAGKRVGCIGMPMTHPPIPVDGFLVPGFDAPSLGRDAIYPPEIFDQAADLLEPLTLHAGAQPGGVAHIAPVLEEITRIGDLALRLQALLPCDCLIVVFPETDHVGHREISSFDPHAAEHPLVRTYIALDEAVGRLLDELASETTTVVLVSDHGMIPVRAVIDLDATFRQLGLQFDRNDAAGRRRASLRRFLRAAKGGLVSIGLAGLVDWATRRRGLTNAISQLNPARPDNVDWTRTRAFPITWDGQVRLNLVGRERDGCVPASQLATVRDEVIGLLRSATGPDGAALFQQVLTAEDAYGTDLIGEGPDILLVPRTGYDLKASRDSIGWQGGMLTDAAVAVSTETTRTGASGMHAPDGILVWCSPHTPAGSAPEGASLQDMAPTLLYAAGVSVPAGLDGRVLEELFAPDFRAARPVQFHEATSEGLPRERSAYSEAEEAVIEDRLRDLGYM